MGSSSMGRDILNLSLGMEHKHLPCRPTGTTSDNYQETYHSGMLHAMIDNLSKTILQGSWRVGDTVVSREKAGQSTSKSEHKHVNIKE